MPDGNAGCMLKTMRAAVCAALFIRFAFAQANPDQLFRSAVDSQERGDFATAIRDYKRLLELQPKSVEVLANLGAALVHQPEFDEAIRDYQAALSLDGGNSAIRLNLALAFYKDGDFARAKEEFEQLHKAEPDNARIATLLGDCYLSLGKNDQGLPLLEDAAKRGTSHTRTCWQGRLG